MIFNLPGLMLLICFLLLNFSNVMIDFLSERFGADLSLSFRVIIIQVLVFLPVTMIFSRILKQNFSETISIKKISTGFIPFIITLSLWLPVAFTLFNILLISNHIEPASNGLYDHLKLNVAAACIVPAVLEEFFFRGVFLKALLKGGDIFAVVFSALMFAVFHNNIDNFLWPFFAGLIYGFMAITFRSVWPCVFAHIINNLFSYYAYYFLIGLKQDTEFLIWLFAVVAIFIVLTYIGLSQYQQILAGEALNPPGRRASQGKPGLYALTTIFSLPVIAVIIIYIKATVWQLIYFNGGIFS